MIDWQPMETAPKDWGDRSRLLLWIPDATWMGGKPVAVFGYWDERRQTWWDADPEYGQRVTPSHWAEVTVPA